MTTPGDVPNPGPEGRPSYGPPGQQPPDYGQLGYGGTGSLSPSDERLWATLAHAGSIFFGFIAPLVVLLVQGEKSPFVRRHSGGIVELQITLAIAYFVSAILVIVLIGFVMLLALAVAHLVLAIMASVAANKGDEYRYPVAIRLVK